MLRHSHHPVVLDAAVIFAVVGLAAMVASDAGLARPQSQPGVPARPAFALGEAQQGPAVRTSLPTHASICVAGRRPGSYGWPVKPFDQQHPIRAFFGDPRTVFRAADDADLGAFSFHNGVDIVAADGTLVYPVVSGVVSVVKPDEIVVTTHPGFRTFQYWHLVPMVRLREHVRARRTALGRVQPGRAHVHLTEIDGGVVENPLQPGHLSPYRDDTPPTVEELYFHDRTGHKLNPEAITGSVEITAAAADTPPLPLPAPWTGVPVTPARVSWQLRTRNGRDLLPEQTPADFLVTAPPPKQFWSVYAAGTYQNFPAVGAHYLYGTPGDYLFNLTPSPLDTRLAAARPLPTHRRRSRHLRQPRNPQRADPHPAPATCDTTHRNDPPNTRKTTLGEPAAPAPPLLDGRDRDAPCHRATQPGAGGRRLHPRHTPSPNRPPRNATNQRRPIRQQHRLCRLLPLLGPRLHSRTDRRAALPGRAPEPDRPAAATTSRTETADSSPDQARPRPLHRRSRLSTSSSRTLDRAGAQSHSDRPRTFLRPPPAQLTLQDPAARLHRHRQRPLPNR